MITKVVFSRRAQKQFKKVPHYVLNKLEIWNDLVELNGIEKVRQIPGYHDEPLKGDRRGQRFIRLNIHWRAIYEIREEKIEFIEVQEITHHGY